MLYNMFIYLSDFLRFIDWYLQNQFFLMINIILVCIIGQPIYDDWSTNIEKGCIQIQIFYQKH